MRETRAFLLALLAAVVLYPSAIRSQESDPCAPTTAAVLAANELFWEIYGAGDYCRIDEALDTLAVGLAAATTADDQPGVALMTARLGWIYTWRGLEFTRQQQACADNELPPNTLDTLDLGLAMAYFNDAVARLPGDCRESVQTAFPAAVIGFQAASTGAYGETTQNAGLIASGQDLIESAINEFEWFNTGTFVAATIGTPAADGNTDPFTLLEDVNTMWQIIRMCSRVSPEESSFSLLADEYGGVLSIPIPEGGEETVHQVCINSEHVAHNLESTYLLLGDLMFNCLENPRECSWPEGNLDEVKRIWGIAKTEECAAPDSAGAGASCWETGVPRTSYEDWVYREILEARLAAEAEDSPASFGGGYPDYPPCLVCHQD